MNILNTRTISSPISSPFGIAGSRFNPLNWFKKGEPGAWYDPSDFQPNWRRNLLTWSEDFSNAVWSKAGVTITSNSIIGPNNVLDASTITRTTTGANEAMVRFVSAQIANTVYTVSVYVKLGTIGNSLYLRNLAIDAGNVTGLVKFNLTTGTVDLTFGATYAGKTSIVSVGNGWYRCSITGTTLATIAANAIDIGVTSLATIGGSANDYLYIDYAQLEQSSSASTYQKITDGIQDYYTVQPQPVLFQDSAGTTPVTAVEQPVGLMLDKSKGLALGAELVTNGDFSNGTTGWTVINGGTITVSLGVATIANGVASETALRLPTLLANTYYIFSADVISIATLGSFYLVPPKGGSPSNIAISTTGSKKGIIYSGSGGSGFRIAMGSIIVGASYSITNISVKQIAGNHAFQATAGNRPLLSARVNLLTKTEDFSDNTVWSKVTTTVTPNDVIAPDGTLTASKIVFANNSSEISCGGFTLTGATLGTAWVKGTAGQTVHFYDGVTALTPSLLTGVWQQLSFTSSTGLKYFDLGASNGATARTVWLWHPDLRPTNSGALLPAYQRVNTASDYDTVGFPLYLKANGTSSAMSTNSIDFTATDKMTVVMGVRKLSDAATGGLIELSADWSANNGSFLIASPNGAALNYVSAVKGSLNAVLVANGFSAPIASVLTLLGNISGDLAQIRVSGAILVTATNDLGISNFGNYPLYLFAKSGTGSFLNGQFYGAIIRGAQSDTASVTQTENYMAQKTGITF